MARFLETPLLQWVPKRLPPGSRKIFLEIRRKQTALPMGELRPSELPMKEKELTRSIQNKGLYLALVSQLNKLARHNRQGSFRTKDRYYEACKRFCGYLLTSTTFRN